MAALMSALTKNPASALTFFAGADREQRVAYYLGHRVWWDGKAAVTAALDVAATTFTQPDDPRTIASVSLTSAVVEQLDDDTIFGPQALKSVGHLFTVHLATPAGLNDLPRALQVSGVGDDPRWVANWWASVSSDLHDLALEQFGSQLGNLDGLPAASRDIANRAVLAGGLSDARADVDRLERLFTEASHKQYYGDTLALSNSLDQARRRLAMLEAVDTQLNIEQKYPPSLYLFDGTSLPGRAAIAFGDMDSAENIAVLVPGMGSHVTNYMGYISDNAARTTILANEIQAIRHDSGTTATLAWIGYDAPGLDVVFTHDANVGQPLLSGTLWGIQASHDAAGNDPHLSVLGHSYGSFLSGLTATKDNPIDELVLFGSPGAAVDSAYEFKIPAGHVFVGEAQGDFVADLDRFGPDPSRLEGVTTFQTDGGDQPLAGQDTLASSGHSQYYLANTESLWNIAAVVTGHTDSMTTGFTPGMGDLIRDDMDDNLGF